jgi:large subunit ribosomal protein L11
MVTIKLMVEGGKMAPGPAVAQQLGPMGVNMGQIISDVNDKTGSFKGMSVPVVLDIDADTKEYKITVLSPPTSELLKKEMGAKAGSGNRIKTKIGNLAFEQVLSVAIQKHDNMLSNTLRASITSVLGTCQAMGAIVESKEIKEVMELYHSGEYDAIIEAKKTDVDAEKAKELAAYFSGVAKEQEKEAAIEAAEAAEKAKA